MEAVGFIGLGRMGQPMALNLVRGGVALTVWNRTHGKCQALEEAGALVARDAGDVFRWSKIVIMMLINETSMDAVLARKSEAFAERVRGRTIVHMGTTSPEYSSHLAKDIQAAGGTYVESPVSGSRKPAEEAQLVAMLAGDNDTKANVQPLLALMCRSVVDCGQVPNGLSMKLSINLFMISMVTGLVEAFHFADRQGLSTAVLEQILNDSPMANSVARVKADKLVKADFQAQATIEDVYKNTCLIAEAAHKAQIPTPLIRVCKSLYQKTRALGFGGADMVAVLRALERRKLDVASLR